MVQIIANNQRPRFADRLNSGIQQSIPVAQNFLERYEQRKALNQENESAKKLGIDLAGISDPALRKEITSKLLQARGKESLLEQKQNFISRLFGNSAERNQSPQIGEENQERQSSNPDFQTQTQGQAFDPLKISDEDIVRASAIDPVIGRDLRAAKDAALTRRREEKEDVRYEEKKKTDKEKEFFKLNEPKVIQLNDDLRKLETEHLRYDRLQNLFQDPSKFPSSLTAAIFTKDGNINDIVYSQLTPEAQEAIKLIVDSTSNIKDSYGARVTNFDLQTYLKKLPSLLNSPEGKMRVLRDLKIMNQLNQMHAKGIQDIFDEKGGTDKIPFSTAEKLYKQKYGKQEEELKSRFVNPEKQSFNEMPDPEKYLGRKIKNPETEEIFISDGNEWKLFKG